MFFRKKDKSGQAQLRKSAGKIDKLVTGVIIGGAIGSVLGATLSDKDRREKIREKGKEFIGQQSQNIREQIKEQRENRNSITNKFLGFFRKK